MLIENVRKVLEEKCTELNKEYKISLGAGYAKFDGENDTVQKCVQRADNNLYLDKGVNRN